MYSIGPYIYISVTFPFIFSLARGAEKRLHDLSVQILDRGRMLERGTLAGFEQIGIININTVNRERRKGNVGFGDTGYKVISFSLRIA